MSSRDSILWWKWLVTWLHGIIIAYLLAVKDECPVLPDPTNGQVEQLLTDGLILPGSIAIYSCDVGLVPDRSRFRECTADLTWSGIPPACIQGKIMWVNFLLIYVLPSGAEGIVESLSNEFIIGLPSLSVYTSQYLIVTTNGQRVPFIVLGNQFDSISNVEYTYNIHCHSEFPYRDRHSHKSKSKWKNFCSKLAGLRLFILLNRFFFSNKREAYGWCEKVWVLLYTI